MKKIILIVILLACVVYAGSKIYIINAKDQIAQAIGNRNITDGALLNTTVQAGETILFTLTTPTPLSDSEISNIYLELLGTNIPSFPTKVSVSGNTTTLSARIPQSVAPKAEYEVIISTMPGKGSLDWFFNETMTVTAIPEAVIEVPAVTTQTENESEVTGFAINYTQPNPKDLTTYKIDWTGAGRGITAWKVVGTGSGIVKQFVHQTVYPLESSGYRVTSPFTYINLDGFGATGSSEAILINTSSKPLDLQVTFTPKGRDNTVVPGYGKTLTIKVPPTPYAITATNPTKLHVGDTVDVRVKSPFPITNLLASLRKYPEVELRLTKLNNSNVYAVLNSPEFNTNNSFTFVIPKEIDVYKNVAGKLEKKGVEEVVPGKYRLSLKTVFGYAYQDVVVVK